jgi:hypothetical protein
MAKTSLGKFKDIATEGWEGHSGLEVQEAMQPEIVAARKKIGFVYYTTQSDDLGKYYAYSFKNKEDYDKWAAIVDKTTAEATALVLDKQTLPDTHRESGTVVVITNRTLDGSGKVTTAITKKLGNKVVISFAYDQINNQTDQSTGVTGVATIGIVTATNVKHVITKTLKAGNYDIDVTDYIAYGTNQISLTVVAGIGDTAQSASAAWAVELVNMQLSSTYKYYSDITKGTAIRVPFKLICNGSSKVLCYIDGDKTNPQSLDLTDGGSNSFSIDTSSMSHGTHTLQLVAAMYVDTVTTIYSNSIMFGLAIKETGNETPLLMFQFGFEDGRIFASGESVTVDVDQYSEYEIDYACSQSSNVKISVDSNTVSDTAVTAYTAMTYKGRALSYGTEAVSITSSTATFPFTLNIIKSSVQITETVDGLKLKLSAQGRSNSDTDKSVWKSGNIVCDLKNFSFDADGWKGSYLRHKAADRSVINWQPLSLDNYSNHDSSFSAVIKYHVGETTNDDAVLIDCTDSEGTGFKISATQIMITAGGGSTTNMRLAPGAEYEVAFVSHPWDTSDNECGMMYLYIDGEKCGAVQRTSTETIYQSAPVNVTMGSSEVMLDVYNIRIYEKALSDSEVLGLYIYDQDTTDDMLSLYAKNNIMSGDTVDLSKLPDGMRIVIITGEEEDGTATVLKAAQVNNKKIKYPVTDIISYVKGATDLTKNIHVLGGYIKLQGTSSLGYPVKNLNLYDKNTDGTLPEMHIGCDENGNGGTLSTDNLWSFRKSEGTQKAGAPVICYCIKADSAESSSSHNTGFARLVNYVLKQVDDITPAQRYVDTTKYAYDVRSSVDGEPCLVFYRNTLSGTLHFYMKGNFNNDKSTEAVFGYRDIPGYHDSDTMKAAFGAGVNPVQCWEFLNNTEPLCNFIVTDAHNFDDNWANAFEGRFPDGGTDTTYLKKIVEWISSTSGNSAKFKNEASSYLDMKNVINYYVLTLIFAMVDQRAKNQMLHIYFDPTINYATDAMKGMRGGMEFYDNDTINALINNGLIRLLWDVDYDTLDGESYAFAGHDSVLWANVRAAFPDEIESSYRNIRSVLTTTLIYKYLDTDQRDRYPAAIFNLDSLQKYIYPATEGVTVIKDGVSNTVKYSFLGMLQGDRKAHEHWWLNHRLELLDARYMGGSYTSPALEFKSQWTAATAETGDPTTHTLKLVSKRNFYYALKGDQAIQRSEVLADATHEFTQDGDIAVGTAFYFYGGAWAKLIDLSGWAGMDTMNFNGTFPVLEELLIGRTDDNLTTLSIGSSLPGLKKLTLSKHSVLKNLDLSGCTLLENVDLSGCTSMTEATLPDGCPLTALHLPASFTALTLKGMPDITTDGITFDAIAAIKRLRVENCANISGFDIVEKILNTTGNNLAYLRITGINTSGDGTILKTIYNNKIGGITSDSLPVNGSCALSGTYQLTKYMEDSLCATIQAYMPELTIVQPQFTMIEFDDSISDDANVSNLDNSTGYKFGNKYVPNGHIKTILSRRFRCLGKQAVKGTMSIYPLHDSNSNYYADADDVSNCTGSKLDGSEGDAFVYEPHYWYKGINDIINNKHYSCFSSNKDKPSCPAADVITWDDIQTGKRVKAGNKIMTGKGTLADSYSADTNYSVCNVTVSGHKRVRFPSVPGTSLVGSIFTDKDGAIVSSVCISGLAQKFTEGMYIVADIPDTATELYFTIMNTAEFDGVILSDSTKIEDMEPDWVEHTECLTAVFESSIYGNKIRSCITGSQSAGSMSWTDFNFYSSSRGMQQVDYEMHKDVANLFFAKYGRRDSQSQLGRGQNSYQRITGGTAVVGMTDTENPDAKSEYAWYYSNGAYVQISSSNCLGYEDWFGDKWEMMDNVSLPNGANNMYYKFLITMPDGTQRKVKGCNHELWITAVAHGKYMDVVPVGTISGSESTYYGDYYTPSSGSSRVVYRSCYSAYANGGVSCMSASYDASSHECVYGSRLAFRGKIEKSESVSAFKALIEIA